MAQAIREASARQIRCHGLAVENKAKPHLATIFGAGRYDVLCHPADLPGAIASFLLRLKH